MILLLGFISYLISVVALGEVVVSGLLQVDLCSL
jgi:hypothetical protein